VEHTRLRDELLITTNLLSSSSALLQGMQYGRDALIRDMSSLIDLFCLYDNVYTLARHSDGIDPGWELSGRLGELLQEQEFVKAWVPCENETEEIALAANAHLLTFLQEEATTDKFQNLIAHALTPDAVKYGLRHHPTPDDDEAIKLGQQWLATAPDRGDLVAQLEKEDPIYGRALTFLIRTFLYLACADKAGANFRPDTARDAALQPVLTEQERLRDNLQERLGTTMEDTYLKLAMKPAALPLASPFAALVFQRAGDDKEAIVREMKKLREQAAGLRLAVQDIETKWRQARTADEADRVKKDWEEVVKELSGYWPRSYRRELATVVGRWALRFAAPMISIMGNSLAQNWFSVPESAVSAADALADTPVHELKKLVQGGTVIEMYRVLPRNEVPNPEQVPALLERLLSPSLDEKA
jgi:hypothetical protein